MLRILALALVALGIAAGVMGQQVYEPGNGVTLPRVIKEVRPQYTPQAKESCSPPGWLTTSVLFSRSTPSMGWTTRRPKRSGNGSLNLARRTVPLWLSGSMSS